MVTERLVAELLSAETPLPVIAERVGWPVSAVALFARTGLTRMAIASSLGSVHPRPTNGRPA